MTKYLARLNSMAAGKIPDAPVGQLLGFQVTKAEEGRVVIELATSNGITIR